MSHLAILDAVPVGEALARANATFAQRWPHWFFFGLPDKQEQLRGHAIQSGHHMAEEVPEALADEVRHFLSTRPLATEH